MAENESETSDSASEAGGVIRSVFRNIKFMLRAEAIGSFPTEAIARSADKLSQFQDIKESVQGAHEKLKNSVTNPIKLVLGTIGSASVGIVKSGVLGWILFSVHDSILNFSIPIIYQSSTASLSRTDSQDILIPSLLTSASGALSGAIHGIISAVWDNISHRVHHNIVTSQRSHVIGTMFSHGMVHLTLFGSYELMKRMSLNRLKYFNSEKHHDLNDIVTFSIICISGAVSGCLADTVGQLTLPFEVYGATRKASSWRRSMIFFRKKLKFRDLTSRAVFSAAVPSMLGFLAYEYASLPMLNV